MALGAAVLVEASVNGRITPDLIARMKARAHALAKEPGIQSALLTTGKGGPHRVEGVGIGFVPPF